MRLAKVLAMLSVVGLAGAALAQDDSGAKSRPARMPLMGKIVKVDGAKITIKTFSREGPGEEKTVTTDDKTVVTIDGKEAKVADLKADMMAGVTPAEGVATKVAARTPALMGRVVKVDGAKITIKTFAMGGGGEEKTVTTDDKTAVTLDGKEAKLADLKADMFVRISPVEGTATKVDASTTMPGRGGRGGAGGGGNG